MTAGPTSAGREPGLRERKKAETRQRISDLATGMFLAEGFDAVRVADVAARAGVSEKTVFNYFPTKESLLFDQFDQQLAQALAAVTQRPAGVSPIRAYVEQIKRQMAEMTDEGDFARIKAVIPRFGEMLEQTPTLRAAWGDHRHRMVDAVAHALAEDLGVDALDPEPRTAARALVSLTELSYDSILRNIELAGSGREMLALVGSDLDRGARLLDTGMWSLTLMIGGRRSADQLHDAARIAEKARQQVVSAVREARRAWREGGHHPGHHALGGPGGGGVKSDSRRLQGRDQA